MPVLVDLVDDEVVVDSSKDSIVIIEVIAAIKGGKSLDVTGYPLDVLKAGHVIIKETATGNYKPMPVVVSGGVSLIGSITPGSGYTNNGTYTNVSLTGGSGSGAKATIVVAGNVVTSVEITTPGTGYKSGDILSAAAANIGTNGSGFQFAVTSAGSTATGYDSLPAGHTYVGILIATILAKRPFAAIMLEGYVNENASPFSVASIKSAFMTATLNEIKFRGDLS